jgi:hypothetical protein|tara:strand:+ start:262 stop:633 length:372 start_codon:yes stop_codon:yes gene_type:complete
MKLSNKLKEEMRDLAFIMAIVLLFLLCFSVVSGQNMMMEKFDIPKVELNLDTKPQNFKQKNQINERVIVFIAGTTLTTIGITEVIINKNSHFKYSNVGSAIPINPYNMLIGVGLLTMSFSFVF